MILRSDVTSGTDDTELSRIREEYGDLMNEEEKADFPTAENLRIHRLTYNEPVDRLT